ncbi:alkaline phosphatase family protein [Tessaracoccus sp. OS52]|uniref:alkaline phosphatase family protein n=1 Tax=Tessaracoccus sp. OS52 TaxID=2886691 RepID=UPI001D10230D|nr:nucleotide pyrophosphatase/phosphodiesterase family protein [Tessaracoccus sp. OS52]MCC2592816.1 alkaline phosphatase family protein [Tessaracoccus sp. OS52]
MSAEFILPDYAGATLANLLPSIEARLVGGDPVLDLPRAHKYVVFLVDGLGWHPLAAHADHAEYLSGLLPGARRLTCSVPSTTATSLTSLGCGVPPGRHGVVGYTFLDPAADSVLNALSWEGGPDDVAAFTLTETVFERLGRQGHGAAAVSLTRFSESALTRMAFGGTDHHGVEFESDPEHFVELVGRALEDSDVIYCYERLLDHHGHGHGVGSWQWLDELARIDDLVKDLAAELPDGVCLLVTGDHGMVNVPVERKIIAENHPELAGFRHIAGEGRFRQLYTDDAARVAAGWSRFLGDRASVVLREDALAAGWFGPDPDPVAVPRIGDVLVAMHDDWAIMSTDYPGEFGLVGMHGSLTAAEMLVPLFAIGPR